MATINEKERSALKMFRERISDLVENMDSYDRGDHNLVRWLRARELDLDKAEDMLRKSMKWREENKIDTILTDWRCPDAVEYGLQTKVPGCDKDGCIVSVQSYGAWDLKGLADKGYGPDYHKFMIRLLEQARCSMKRESPNRKTPVTQVVLVFDLEGFSMRQLASREKIHHELNVLKSFEANYPEVLKHAYIVNAPKIFELLFALFKPILTGTTLSKVKLFGSNSQEWRAVLLENIDPDELPSDYGGANTSCEDYHVSAGLQWNKRGKLLSKELFKDAFVPAGQKLDVDINLTEPKEIMWNFKTDEYDLGFQFSHEGTKIFNVKKADAHLHVQKGIYYATKPGKYTLTFDNSYSKFRGKNMHYAYTLSPLQDSEQREE